MAGILYDWVYCHSDKTVSVVPKSRCILVDEFKELVGVKVNWSVQGKQTAFLRIILHVCLKRKYNTNMIDLHYLNTHWMENVRFIHSYKSVGLFQ